MLKKEKVIKGIESLINLEKRVLPLLNRHISSSLFFSELKESERNAILEAFQKIAVAQGKHSETLNQIKDEALKMKTDVY